MRKPKPLQFLPATRRTEWEGTRCALDLLMTFLDAVALTTLTLVIQFQPVTYCSSPHAGAPATCPENSPCLSLFQTNFRRNVPTGAISGTATGPIAGTDAGTKTHNLSW